MTWPLQTGPGVRHRVENVTSLGKLADYQHFAGSTPVPDTEHVNVAEL